MNNIRFEPDVLQYLPTWYKNIAEYQQICGAESAQMELAKDDTERVYGNFYFSTMDAAGLSDWEDLFGLTVSEDDTLEFRRARVINRLTMKPPFSIRFLRQQLDNLIGVDQYNLILDAANYTLYVESSAESQAYAIEVTYLINHIKPAHIVYINTPLVKGRLKVNETIEKSTVTYNYGLGSWGLGLQTFASAPYMEVVKMATVKSITADGLHDVANGLAESILLVRLNEHLGSGATKTITDLTKSVSDNVVTVEYTVLPSDLPVTASGRAILSIAVYDDNYRRFSGQSVFIPIPNETRIKHTYLVEEAV